MARRQSDPPAAPGECANCGAAIPRGAKACPECGADERTGWRDTDLYDGLDLPDEAFTDAPEIQHPAAAEGRGLRRVHGLPWYWWCAGIGLIAVLILGSLALL